MTVGVSALLPARDEDATIEQTTRIVLRPNSSSETLEGLILGLARLDERSRIFLIYYSVGDMGPSLTRLRRSGEPS